MELRRTTARAHALRAAIAVLCATALAGCALGTVPYQPSIDSVERLRGAGLAPIAVGEFSVARDATGGTTISLRGNPMSSSVGANYADYLAAALRQELELARLLDPKASVEVGGMLMRNDISAGGISTNSGEIEARFVVRRAGQVRFDRTKRAALSWESGFMAATAIPAAQQHYPLMVQKLLGALFADPDFIAACR